MRGTWRPTHGSDSTYKELKPTLYRWLEDERESSDSTYKELKQQLLEIGLKKRKGESSDSTYKELKLALERAGKSSHSVRF